MPTNDERQEVAENLRIMTAYGCRYAEQFYELLQETVMRECDFHSFTDVADRLADLIEAEPERTCRDLGGEYGTNYEAYDFGCSECGFGCDIPQPNYCPHCGAKVVE